MGFVTEIYEQMLLCKTVDKSVGTWQNGDK